MEGSASLSVNFGGLCTGLHLRVNNMQIRFYFMLVPFSPVYCCCVDGNADVKSSISNCNSIYLWFSESSISVSLLKV